MRVSLEWSTAALKTRGASFRVRKKKKKLSQSLGRRCLGNFLTRRRRSNRWMVASCWSRDGRHFYIGQHIKIFRSLLE